MRAPVYVFDPTIADAQSKVRGIGRYLQILKENAPQDWLFTGSFQGIPPHAVLVQPFYNLLHKPLITRHITDRQIAVIHDLIPQKYPSHFPIGPRGMWHQFWAKHALGYFDLIITDSEASKADIYKVLHVPEKKIQVLFPTLAAHMWQQAATYKQQKPGDYCLYVGDGTWNKNLVNLARAIKKNDYTCIFAGKVFADTDPSHYQDPWQEELHDFFTIAQGDKRFIFAGYVTDKELINLYEQARCNVLVSRDEGFGFSYVEAGVFGCPSVLADRPIFHEIAGDSCLFADPESPEAIASAIQDLFTHDDLRTQFSLKALGRAKLYSQESFRSHLIQVVYPY